MAASSTEPPTAVARALLTGSLAALALVLAARAAAALYQYPALLFSIDEHILLEAGRALFRDGIGRVEYLPHSSQGWDVFVWSYYLPTYLYAGLAALGVQFTQLGLVHVAQFMCLMGALLALCRRFCSWPIALAVSAVAMADPLFYSIAAEHFHSLAATFALLAVLSADVTLARLDAGRPAAVGAAATGALVAASVLSFAAIGVPFVVGLGLAFLGRWWLARDRRMPVAATIVAFLVGGLVPLVIFLADTAWSLPPETLRELLLVLRNPLADGEDLGATAMVRRAGYFVAGVVVNPRTISLMPAALAFLPLALFHRTGQSASERRAVHLGVGLAVGGIVCGVALPQHVNASRMAFILPMLGIVLVGTWRTVDVSGRQAWLAAAVALLATAGAYQALGRPWDPYGVGVAAAAALLLAATAWFWLRRQRIWSGSTLALVASAGLALVTVPTGINWAISLEHSVTLGTEPESALALAARVRAVTDGVLAPGERVLTNQPFEEFFPPTTQRQLIRFYRGLANGATSVPAPHVVLVTNDRGKVDGYATGARIGETLFYGGHLYCILEGRAATPVVQVLLGAPGACTGNAAALRPIEDVPEHRRAAYLTWRKDNGLSTY